MLAMCAEMVWDVLADKLDTEDTAFDDLMMYCMGRADGSINEGVGVCEWLGSLDADRTPALAAIDMVAYSRRCKLRGSLEELLEKAIRMGRVGLGVDEGGGMGAD